MSGPPPTTCLQKIENRTVSCICSPKVPHLLYLDHDKWWASQAKPQNGDYANMPALTRAYENRALESFRRNLFNTKSEANPNSARPKYLWVNNGYDGVVNANMVELTAKTGSVPNFDDDLCGLLMHATSPPVSKTEPCRRIIIVEDMAERFAEILGVRLNIPPEFFFAHCREQLDLSIVDDTITAQHGRYWRVPVPQRRFLPGDEHSPKGMWSLESGFFHRGYAYISETWGIRIDFESQMSFWATEYGAGSWTGE